jgi:hypothetical protein
MRLNTLLPLLGLAAVEIGAQGGRRTGLPERLLPLCVGILRAHVSNSADE